MVDAAACDRAGRPTSARYCMQLGSWNLFRRVLVSESKSDLVDICSHHWFGTWRSWASANCKSPI